MAKISAFKDSNNPSKVNVTPSGYQIGDEDTVNVDARVSGFDPSSDAFTVRQRALGQVEVDLTNVTGYTNQTVTLNVISSGDFVTTSDNPNITVSDNVVDRTITITVPVGQQETQQSGNLTVHIDTLTDLIIPVMLEGIEDITINATPTGQKQYVSEPIVLTVTGTSRTVVAESSHPSVSVNKDSDYRWTVTGSSVESGVVITFKGDGVKTRTKNFDFQDQEVPVINIVGSSPHFVGSTVDVNITGITLFSGLNVTSSNPNLPITEKPGGSDGEYQITINAAEETTITVVNRGVKETTQTLQGMDLYTMTASPSNVIGSTNTEIRVTISNVNGTLSASADQSDITTRVEGNDVVISSQTPVTGNVTVTCDNSYDLIIPVSLSAQQAISYNLDHASGDLYVGEAYRITIESGLTNVNVICQESRVNPVKVSDSPLVYELVTAQTSGFTPIDTTITITADGRASTSFQLEYQGLTEITVQENHNAVPWDIPIELTIQNGVPGMSAASDNENIDVNLVEDPTGTYKVVCTATEQGDANITIYGRTIVDTKYIVSFVNRDVVNVVLTPSEPFYYAGDVVEVEITGTTRNISISPTLVGGDGSPAIIQDGIDQYHKTITLPTSGRFMIEVDGQGVEPKQVVKEVKELEVPTITFEPDYPHYYVGEDVKVVVSSQLTSSVEVDDGSGSNGVITVKPGLIPGEQTLTASAACNGTIKVSGKGIKETTKQFTVKDLATMQYTATPANTGYVKKGVVIEIQGVDDVTYETSVSEFSITKQ